MECVFPEVQNVSPEGLRPEVCAVSGELEQPSDKVSVLEFSVHVGMS